MQQRAGNGVLDGKHSYHRRVLLHIHEDLLERRTADKLYLLTLKVQVRRNVVERPDETLYSNPFHLLI
jgi:hypothetical protein